MSSQVRPDGAAALFAGEPVRARRTWRDVNCRRFVDKGQFIAGAKAVSNGLRCPRSFRPAGCIEPRNGTCAKSLSCLLVAGRLPSDLFLSAKHLLFAADLAQAEHLIRCPACGGWIIALISAKFMADSDTNL